MKGLNVCWARWNFWFYVLIQVKSEAQVKNSAHIQCSSIACYTSEATNIETEGSIQLTLLSGSHGQFFPLYGERCHAERINHLPLSFQYLGVPVCETSYVCGDNKSQVMSATFPYLRLNKWQNILLYHFVRNMVAKGFIKIAHIPSEYNLTNILSKHWIHQALYQNLIKPLLHFHGNADNLIVDLVKLSQLAQPHLFPLSNNLTLNCSQQENLSY